MQPQRSWGELSPSFDFSFTQIRPACPDPRSIPERADEGDSGLETPPGEGAGEFCKFRKISWVLISPPRCGDAVGCEEGNTKTVAIEQLAEYPRSKVRLVGRRPRLEGPAVGERVHQFRFETRVNSSLVRQLAVVISNRVKRLGEIASIMGRKNTGVLDLAPPSLPHCSGHQQGEPLDLPDGITVPALRGGRSEAFAYESFLKCKERIGVIGVNFGVVVRLLFRAIPCEKVRFTRVVN